MRNLLPVAVVVAAILAIWYAAVAPMNIHSAADMAARNGVDVTPPEGAARRDVGAFQLMADNPDVIALGYDLERPVLPTPGQVMGELYASTIDEELNGRRGIVRSGTLSNRSLIYHGWITLSATLLGFFLGSVLGIALAIGIVHNRAMDMSVMPWAIASQTIPILAIAPMIIVVLNSVGVQGLIPKSMISAYLSFFPVVVGMVKGLRSPDGMQLDLLKTYSATPQEVLWKLRLPASMPYLFTSLKIGIAASLVGAIVGELPTGAAGGLGARLLAGSYYGQTVQIWAALFGAAILAALMVGTIGWLQRRTLRRMGMAI